MLPAKYRLTESGFGRKPSAPEDSAFVLGGPEIAAHDLAVWRIG